MTLPDFFASSAPTTMPGMSSEQVGSLGATTSLKKRKTNPMQEEVVNLAHPAAYPPSSCHFNSSLLYNNACPSFTPKHTSTHSMEEEVSLRSRCLPRKRRLTQLQPQSHLYHQQHQSLNEGIRVSPNSNDRPQGNKLLPPTVCIPTTRDLYSPPVSPKTLIPISYPNNQQQQQSTSATALRPCHICYRRPTTRELLDAYADCDLCGKRACYICLRQCDSAACCGSGNNAVGIDGNKNSLPEYDLTAPQGYFDSDNSEPRQQRKVCSWCAVEGVTDAGFEVVRCLDCVRGQLSHWQSVPPGSVVPIRNGM